VTGTPQAGDKLQPLRDTRNRSSLTAASKHSLASECAPEPQDPNVHVPRRRDLFYAADQQAELVRSVSSRRDARAPISTPDSTICPVRQISLLWVGLIKVRLRRTHVLVLRKLPQSDMTLPLSVLVVLACSGSPREGACDIPGHVIQWQADYCGSS
jgi:hypothetical protein